ncbi:GSCFA domain-containing protein [Segatella oris]|uniref:GSCFA domain-containing protein n=1 Tax=Segatella oris TaxID=28135 RepID=UPI0028F0982B|nr:GSCFA domain-containing protein [Segatella oris]
MEFRTKVEIAASSWQIKPAQHLLFIGSCFAESIGNKFKDEQFPTVINPYGVMYNPASILHSVEQHCKTHDFVPDVTVLTLGTNHVYVLKETKEIVDNCRKRPQSLFDECELSVAQCVDYLQKATQCLLSCNPNMHIIITVSPIRYRKYGFHGSQLGKATLLLAAEQLSHESQVDYFPAYEIMNDELRDYRFYKEDMLHPSPQAVEYIWEQFAETYFHADVFTMMREWKPIKEALQHRPFNPESEDYQAFMALTKERLTTFMKKYGLSPWPLPEEGGE